MYQRCLTAAVLAVCTYTDIRYGKIYKKVAAGYLLLALAGQLAVGQVTIGEAGAGMLPVTMREAGAGVLPVTIGAVGAGALPVTIGAVGVGMIPGVVCLLVSFITRQALGYGDSILICLCGISLGLQNCTGIVLTAFFLSGIWAMVLFVRNRAVAGKTFPFVPFLFVGMMIQVVLQ